MFFEHEFHPTLCGDIRGLLPLIMVRCYRMLCHSPLSLRLSMEHFKDLLSRKRVRAENICELAIAGNVGDSVLYHSLLGLASPQQASGSVAGDEDYSLKWMAAAKCAQ